MILGSAGMVFDPEDICEGGTEPTDADLLGELVRRGVLMLDQTHFEYGRRYITEWEPVGESEPPPGHPDSYPGVSPIPR